MMIYMIKLINNKIKIKKKKVKMVWKIKFVKQIVLGDILA